MSEIKKNQNAFAELLDTMREMGAKDNPITVLVGKVTSASPLVVKINEIEIDKDNLLIADYLLAGYERDGKIEGIGKLQASGTLGTITSPAGSGTLDSVNITTQENGSSIEGKIKLSDGLKAGDVVGLFPVEGNQTFIIFARLVSA